VTAPGEMPRKPVPIPFLDSQAMPKAGQSAAIKKTAIALIVFTIRFDECNRDVSPTGRLGYLHEKLDAERCQDNTHHDEQQSS